MLISLKNSILRILVFSILLTTVLILIVIWNINSNQVNRQLDKDLSVAQAVFKKVSNERREQLLNSASVLTSDFGFKRAIATGDIPTIESVFDNHGGRINADLMLMIDLEGNILTHYPEVNMASEKYPNPELISIILEKGGLDEFQIIEGRLFQIILMPVRAPSVVGIAGIAFEYDDETLAELKQIISGDIIVSTTLFGDEKILASTINTDGISAQEALSSFNMWSKILFENVPSYFSRSMTLPQMQNTQVSVKLAQNITPDYRQMIFLQLILLGISGLVMLVTLSISMLFSKRISRPVSSLVKLADKIALGDYRYGKGFKTRLQEIDELARALFRMRERIESRESEIKFNAEHDMLTGLRNRFYLEKALQSNFGKKQDFQVLGLFLKGFRNINDLYGFSNGDACLKLIAQRLESFAGMKSRLSGGTMCLLPEKVMHRHDLEVFQALLENPMKFDGFTIQIKFVLAMINVESENDDIEGVFRKLNIVLDDAKKTNDSLVFYDSEQEKLYLRRLDIITELKKALSTHQDELFLVYQPKLNLASGDIAGAEALIRWINPKLGFVPPDEFIGIAEQAGMIEDVTRFVMQRAIEDTQMFFNAGLTLNIALNLSTQDIESRALLDHFSALLITHKISPSHFQLEVTESDLVEDANTAVQNLNHLQEAGFTIAIDDFGTGYSSLAYLKNLPIDTIKIDRCFVMELASNKEDQTMVKTVLSLARSFNLSVVAEGIEDEATLQLLKKWGCDFAQGYHIAKPLEKDTFLSFVKERQLKGIN